MVIDRKKLELAKARACMGTKELCAKSGIAPVTLAQMKRTGDSLRPSTVGKLARALSVDVLDIIKDEEEV